ncbi:hypothetical protein BJ508DRAFT_301624 [Ascobolus immersus RN42]|uniref:Uncharacterized protein n=1 Tax=Ascobolus immersus RN42 TaxID=1160509 RepID=A0A3N4IKZ6_ASCIM|nr:hypothetical protein BJ508DRAFT_301624 [Ascobolus immersus RN42]
MSNKSFSVVIPRSSLSSTRNSIRNSSIRSTPPFLVNSFQPSTPGLDANQSYQQPFFPTPQTPLQRQSKELLLHLRTPYAFEDDTPLYPKLVLQMSSAIDSKSYEEYYDQSMGRTRQRRKSVNPNKTNNGEKHDQIEDMYCSLKVCTSTTIKPTQFIVSLIPAFTPPGGLTEIDSVNVTHYHLPCLERLLILPTPELLSTLIAPTRSFFTQSINPLDFRSTILFTTFTLHQEHHYSEIRTERDRIAEAQTPKAIRKRLLEENVIHLDSASPKLKKARSVASLRSDENAIRGSLVQRTPARDDAVFKTPQRPASSKNRWLATPTPARTVNSPASVEPQTPTPTRTLFLPAPAPKKEEAEPGPARLTFAGPNAGDAMTYHPAVPADFYLDEGVDWRDERYWRKETTDWMWHCERERGEGGVPGAVRFAVSRLLDPERLRKVQLEARRKLDEMVKEYQGEKKREEEEGREWEEDLVKEENASVGFGDEVGSEVDQMEVDE